MIEDINDISSEDKVKYLEIIKYIEDIIEVADAKGKFRTIYET